MVNAHKQKWMQIILALTIFALPGVAGAALTFSSIVVFGTSLSDPGNAFTLLAHPPSGMNLGVNVIQYTPPYDALAESLVPSAPYAKGGHHFSNGATWIEQFAKGTGLAANVQPAFQSSSGNARNYAVGGARATPYPNTVNLPDQVKTFLQDVNQIAPPDALYVIEMGSNDLRDALAAYFTVYLKTGSQSQAAAARDLILTGTLNGIALSIQTLHHFGANKFLLWNAPRIDLVPVVQTLGPGAVAIALDLVARFNQGLAQIVSSSAALGIQIAQMDISGQMAVIFQSPGNFGFTNVTNPCVTPKTPPFTCQQPDDYFFWDGIHPTTAVHALLAQLALRTLEQYLGH